MKDYSNIDDLLLLVRTCVINAYERGFAAGKAAGIEVGAPYEKEQAAINILTASGWLERRDKAMMSKGYERAIDFVVDQMSTDCAEIGEESEEP